MPVMGIWLDIQELPVGDQVQLYERMLMFGWFRRMGQQLRPEPPTVREVREARFAEGLRCPRCQSHDVVRHGRMGTRQRYRCRGCGKTFNDLTGTPVAYSKHPRLWIEMAEAMAEGLSIPKTAERLHVSRDTVFRWRHRLLDAMRRGDLPQLAGVVEADETYFPYSRKGQRGQPRRRRGVRQRKLRGLSRQQVAVLTVRDRDHVETAVTVLGRGYPRYSVVGPALGQVLEPDPETVLCADGARHYQRFCQDQGIQYRRVDPDADAIHPIFHIQHVNSYHDRLKRWMPRFRGVSTTRLPNYMTWHEFIDRNRHLSRRLLARELLKASCASMPR